MQVYVKVADEILPAAPVTEAALRVNTAANGSATTELTEGKVFEIE